MVSLNPFRLFNPIFNHYIGGENRDVFFDIDATIPALRHLDSNIEIIQRELDTILPTEIPKYHEVDSWQYKISGEQDPDKDWKVFMLYAFGEKHEVNRAHCPRTTELIDSVPGLFQAFFSILDPGKSIPAHSGPYRGYLRYHLGLRIPKNNPPKIRVKDQFHTWKRGESILFDDSWDHEVINHSDDTRVILIIDVMRPLPPFPHRLNQLIHDVFGKLYGKKLAAQFR
ncbi:MAG: aspartyl/asparaginyl beta-hydroxylase domain-containing protein [Pseudomonadales bacterium]|nr:aspartyl/asparaginyl beta-hydroxylase domain-containing protein [Pseudomonadales bacterium]